MSHEMIIYISKAARLLSSEEVEQMAVFAAAKNKDANITGLLLQIGDHFVQVLEGEAKMLDSLMKKIESDKRHRDLHIIYKASAQSKLFSQWNMGYFNIEQYYHASRKDIVLLRECTQKAFALSKTYQEAIVQIIKSIPELMQNWENKKERPLYAPLLSPYQT